MSASVILNVILGSLLIIAIGVILSPKLLIKIHNNKFEWKSKFAFLLACWDELHKINQSLIDKMKQQEQKPPTIDLSMYAGTYNLEEAKEVSKKMAAHLKKFEKYSKKQAKQNEKSSKKS